MSITLNPALLSSDLTGRSLLPWQKQQRITPKSPQDPIVDVEVHRQPEWAAMDWQLAIRDLWKENPHMSPAFTQGLERLGLMSRCCYFSAHHPDEPLRFRFISAPTIRYFGEDWAKQQLGQPHTADPNEVYAQIIDHEYESAIAEERPVYNRLVLNGPSTPTIYTHLLLSWRLPTGERALLACIDHHAA